MLALILCGGIQGARPLDTLFGYFLWCKRKYLARRCENRQRLKDLPAPAGKEAPSSERGASRRPQAAGKRKGK